METVKEYISLDKFLLLGGKLENINWGNAYCEYDDKNRAVPIVNCINKGEKSPTTKTPLYHFTFENGNTKRYGIMWIKLLVEIDIADRYKG